MAEQPRPPGVVVTRGWAAGISFTTSLVAWGLVGLVVSGLMTAVMDIQVFAVLALVVLVGSSCAAAGTAAALQLFPPLWHRCRKTVATIACANGLLLIPCTLLTTLLTASSDLMAMALLMVSALFLGLLMPLVAFSLALRWGWLKALPAGDCCWQCAYPMQTENRTCPECGFVHGEEATQNTR